MLLITKPLMKSIIKYKIKIKLFITMKREHSKQLFLQLNDYKSPICKETFDSLPKIYGSLKNKILKNKQRFYQMIGTQLKKKSNNKMKQQRSLKTQTHSNNKSEVTENAYKSLKSAKKQSSSKITYQKPREQNQKLKSIKTEVGQNKHLTFNKIGKSDHESQHKVKFNTLHFLPTIRNPMMILDKPETLSQIIDDKVYKSLANSNPLIHLYKSKSPKSNLDNINDQIKQQESEQESPKGSPVRQYIPNHISRGIKRYNNYDSQKSNQGSGKQRIKTEYSNSLEQSHPFKSAGKLTEFSKRLTINAFTESSKFSKFGQNKKFNIPAKDQYKQFIQSYQSINPSFNLPKIITKESFQIITYENAVYFGQYTNVKKGYGLFITQDSLFQGIFDFDSKLTGSQMTYDGIYTGHFKDNLRQGKGRFQWNNGQVYEGGWREGKKNGFGLWKSNNGDSYEGQWLNGRQNGAGTHKHRTGTYKGQFKDSLKHGNGQQFFANGDHYKGLYEKGKPHGIGRYDWSDGSYYEGDFVNGYRDGKGELYEKNGIHYKGSFRRDFKHGWGQEIQKSGEKFVGNFQNGIRVYTQPLKI